MRIRPWQWVAAGIVSGGLLIGFGLNAWSSQIDRIELVACRNYNTLANIIQNQDSPRPILKKLDFDESQILLLEENAKQVQAKQLRQLGTRPDGCEPGEVR